jgi:glyoxylase I family protein
LTTALRTAITAITVVADRHRDTCDVHHPGSPSAIVVALRQIGDKLDYLVLADSVLLLDTGSSVRAVTDDREAEVGQMFRGAMDAVPSGRSSRLGNLPRMPIKFENVGIAVRDLEATIAFFTDLGLTVLGRDTVSGEWTDTAVGLDGNHANIAMLQTPDGNGRLELFEYIHPVAIETEPTRPNEIGMHRVAFSVDDIDEALQIAARHGCHPLRGVATYEDIYKLTYVRGPSGILVMLAEELNTN